MAAPAVAPAATAWHRATYTQQDGHKKLAKNRRWADGFVSQRAGSQEVKLYDEAGAVVAVGKLSAGARLAKGDEIDKGQFGPSILIIVDVPCNASEATGGKAAAAADELPTAAAAGRAAPIKPLGSAPTKARQPGPVGLRPSGGGGRRRGFIAPRPVAAPAATVEPPPAAVPAAPEQQCRRQFVQPPRRPLHPLPEQGAQQPQQWQQQQQAAQQWQQQSTEPSAPAAAAVRSDADILRLIMGQAAAPAPTPPAPTPAAAGPPAKRPRLEPLGAGLGGPPGLSPPEHGWQGEHMQAAAAAAGVPARAAPPAKPRWSAFLDGEDELEAEKSPLQAAAASRGSPGGFQPALAHVTAPEAPAPGRGAAANGSSTAGRQGQGRWLAAEEAAGQPAAPRWAQWEAGQEMGGCQPDSSPPGSTHRPIVRPPQAASLAAQQQAQQQGWPLSRQQPQQQQQPPPQSAPPRCPPAGTGAGPSGWKAPAVLAPAAGGGVARQQLGGGPPLGAAPRPLAPAAAGPPAPSQWNQQVGGVLQLGWPSAAEAARPARRVALPDGFVSSQQYVQAWNNALLEELNLRLAEVAHGYHSAVARANQQQPTQHAGRGGPGRQPGRGFSGGGRGGRGSMAGGAPRAGGSNGGLEAALRQGRVPYYGNCELFIWKNNLPKKGGAGGRKGGKRGRQDDGSEEEGEGGSAAKPDSIYLILKGGRQKSAEYRRDDLWVLSSTPDFRTGPAPGQPYDRSRLPWVAVARSLWHGPNQDGKMEVEFLSARPPGLGRSQAVYAIKGPDASTELGMIELLRSGAAATLPILPALMRAPGSAVRPGSSSATPGRGPGQPSSSHAQPSPAQPGTAGGPPGSPSYSCTSEEEDEEAALAAAAAAADGLEESPFMQAQRIIEQFKLNTEQAEVLQFVASWSQPAPSRAGSASKAAGGAPSAAPARSPPVCLVHGPFGSGKSTLLVAILHFLLQQRGRQGSPLAKSRVLVAAHTNVAVDRVLLGLLESGCTEFLRVGPLRRIARSLLAQSLHASESRSTATAAAELREMLREASDPSEVAVIRAELAAAERGADRQRKRLLKTVPVVGVTCCSSMLAALDGQQFDVVILDECSQMVEPLSAVPLLRAKARYLIAAGDPLQLPPVIASPAHVTPGPQQQQHRPPAAQQQQRGAPQGLLRPLFVRLAALGLPPFLLRKQYRCHPDISAIPNAHFYGGRLLDGCSREQRASLLPGLPSLSFLDVRGQQQYSAGRSASNQAEAEAVVAAVVQLVASGVGLHQCGVICFFRAQVALIKSLLDRRLPQLAPQQPQQNNAQAASAGEGSWDSEGEPPRFLDLRKGRGGSSGAGGSPAGGGGDGQDGGGEERAQQAQQGIQLATVDSFQGAERDVVLLSTAVTQPGAFASDACRLNVALTRAKHNLLVVGHGPVLQQSAPAFAALLAKCRGTPGGYFPGRLPPAAALAAHAQAAQQEQRAVPGGAAAGGQQVQRPGPAAGGTEKQQEVPQPEPAGAAAGKEAAGGGDEESSWSTEEEEKGPCAAEGPAAAAADGSDPSFNML